MYKNILVAIDESSTSDLALKEAIAMVSEHPQSFLRVIHVFDDHAIPLSVSYAISASVVLENKKALKNAALALLKKAASVIHAAHISNFETKLLEMKPEDRIYQSITDEAKSWPADLIIIGTHGRKGFNHFLLGSVAEGVARIATVPVLLIRGKESKTK